MLSSVVLNLNVSDFFVMNCTDLIVGWCANKLPNQWMVFYFLLFIYLDTMLLNVCVSCYYE